MPSIMVNGKLATVDGVQVPVTTGCFADVVRYLESKKVKPVEETPKEPEVKAEEATKEATPKAAAKALANAKPAEEAPKE